MAIPPPILAALPAKVQCATVGEQPSSYISTPRLWTPPLFALPATIAKPSSTAVASRASSVTPDEAPRHIALPFAILAQATTVPSLFSATL